MPDALVNGVVDAGVLFTHPIGKPVRMTANEIPAPIGGSAVDDQVFIVGEGLVENAVHSSLQAVPVVSVDGNYGDPHCRLHFLKPKASTFVLEAVGHILPEPIFMEGLQEGIEHDYPVAVIVH